MIKGVRMSEEEMHVTIIEELPINEEDFAELAEEIQKILDKYRI